jgi:hypothetical protein
MEFPTSGRQWRDSDVVGAKQNTCIKFFYFFLLGRNGRCSFVECDDIFLRRVYVRHVIQMMFINIATGIKLVVQIQVLKTPIYYMYSDWATALSAVKSPISGRGKPAESS